MLSPVDSAVEAEVGYPSSHALHSRLHHLCNQIATAVHHLFRPSHQTTTASPHPPTLSFKSLEHDFSLEHLAQKNLAISQESCAMAAAIRAQLLGREEPPEVVALDFNAAAAEAVKRWQSDPCELAAVYLRDPSAHLADVMVNGILGEHCCGDGAALEWLAAVLRECEGKAKVAQVAVLAFGYRIQLLEYITGRVAQYLSINCAGGEGDIVALDQVLAQENAPAILGKVVRVLERCGSDRLSPMEFLQALVKRSLEVTASVCNMFSRVRLKPVLARLEEGERSLDGFLAHVKRCEVFPAEEGGIGSHCLVWKSDIELLNSALLGRKNASLEVAPCSDGGAYLLALEAAEASREVKVWRGIHALLVQTEEALFREAVAVHPRLAFDSRLEELQQIYKNLQILRGQAYNLSQHIQQTRTCVRQLEVRLNALKELKSKAWSPHQSSVSLSGDLWESIKKELQDGVEAVVCGTKLQEGIRGVLCADHEVESITLNTKPLFKAAHVVSVKFEELSEPIEKLDRPVASVNILLRNEDLLLCYFRSSEMALLWTYALQRLSGHRWTMHTMSEAEYLQRRAICRAKALDDN